MLPASWPILRAQGVHVGRAHIQRQLNLLPHSRRLSNSPRTRHSATVFLRQTHHFVDSPDSNEKTRNAYPIDVFDDVDAIRRLVVLVQRGNFEDAGEVITDIIDFATANGDLDAFRQIKSILVTPETPNIPLLSQFGISLATRGHTDFVTDEIIPIVKHLGTPEHVSRIEASLAAAKSAPLSKSRLAQSADVFEESSEDYQRIQDGSIAPKPSITELIETQLPPLLPELTADCSIFEDPAEEYLEHLSTSAQDHSASVSTGVLVDLVKTNQYTKAYRLLQEMRDLGVDISPSAEFENAAIAIFRKHSLLSPEKIEEFFAWLTLIPPRDASSNLSFAQKWRPILNAPLTDITLLRRFSLTLVSKGYARDVAVQNVATIIRHSNAEAVRSFMEEFNLSYQNFCKRHPPDLPEDMPDHIFEWSRGMAIRALTYNNRLPEALDMLPDPNNPRFKLPIDAYYTLLRHTRLAVNYRTYIPVIKKLRKVAATISGNTQAPRAKIADPFDFGKNLASGLRYLKNTIGSSTEIPHHSTLVNFMNGYLATGRTIALKMLIEKAIRNNFLATRNFVFAEMLFYRRLKKYDLIIKAFVDHFHLSGVPREAVLQRLDFIRRQNLQGMNLRRFYDFNDGRSLPVGKVWPLTEHCNLIWEALAKTTKNDADLKRLYDELVSFARTGKDAASNSVIAATDPLIPTVRRRYVGAAAFTPFFAPLMHVYGPDFGTTILRDMLACRLLPTRYHFSQVAGFYARGGHVEQAFSILDRLEKNAQFRMSRPSWRTGQNFPKKFKVPKYDMVIYTSMIRGFIISRKVGAAVHLVERLDRSHGYSEGEDQHLDAAIADLIDLKELGDNWVSFLPFIFFNCSFSY
jgi:hypothetical protein